MEKYEKQQKQINLMCYLVLGSSAAIAIALQVEEFWKWIKNRPKERRYFDIHGTALPGRDYQDVYSLNTGTATALPGNNGIAERHEVGASGREQVTAENLETERLSDTEIVREEGNSRLGAYEMSRGKQKTE